MQNTMLAYFDHHKCKSSRNCSNYWYICRSQTDSYSERNERTRATHGSNLL